MSACMCACVCALFALILFYNSLQNHVFYILHKYSLFVEWLKHKITIKCMCVCVDYLL